MFSSAFKTAWRALRRRPGTTALNVVGLGISLGVALLVLLFIRDQWRLDRFHPGADQIHRVVTEARGSQYATAPEPLAEALREAPTPGVEAVVEVARISETFVTTGDRSLTTRALFADNAFWTVFDGFELRHGSRTSALSEPRTAVISEPVADALYGSQNPVGETIQLEADRAYTVVGVMASPPGPTHMAADVIFAPSSSSEVSSPSMWENMYNQYVYTRLAPGADPKTLRAAATSLFEKNARPDLDEAYSFSVESLGVVRFGGTRNNDIHPRTQLPNWMYGILGVLALVGVIAAAFNYINLTVARSLTRAREVGVRKSLGAHRGQLIPQFLGEAVLTALLSGGIATLIFLLLAPVFNGLFMFNLIEVQAVDSIALTRPMVIGLIGGVCVLTGLVAGLYPAVRLSRFDPAEALSGQGGGAPEGGRVRTVLIAGQVACSIFLLISAATLLRQTEHMAQAGHELRTERLIAVELEDVEYETFQRVVGDLPDVETTAALSNLMLGPSNYDARDILLPNETETRRPISYAVDSTFISDMGLSLIAHRSNWATALMAEEGVVFDRNAISAYGYDAPSDFLGTEITLPELTPSTRTVVGVVENFESGGIAEVYGAGIVNETDPKMLYWLPDAADYALVRSQSGNLALLRDRLEKTWRTRLNTAHPFAARYYSDVTRMRYGPLEDAAFMTAGVAGLAILIAILGLLSLAAHHVQTRRKEIGIRKALGARVYEIVLELSKGFSLLVVGAALVATPLAWMLNRWWLQFFSDRVNVSSLVVAVCVSGLIGLALFVIGSQTIRAARVDPANTLRDE